MKKVLVYDDDLSELDIISIDEESEEKAETLENYDNYLVLSDKLEADLIKAVDKMRSKETEQFKEIEFDKDFRNGYFKDKINEALK